MTEEFELLDAMKEINSTINRGLIFGGIDGCHMVVEDLKNLLPILKECERNLARKLAKEPNMDTRKDGTSFFVLQKIKEELERRPLKNSLDLTHMKRIIQQMMDEQANCIKKKLEKDNFFRKEIQKEIEVIMNQKEWEEIYITLSLYSNLAPNIFCGALRVSNDNLLKFSKRNVEYEIASSTQYIADCNICLLYDVLYNAKEKIEIREEKANVLMKTFEIFVAELCA